MLDQPFATLFEPVKLGPVTAPNRFYQVPHCTGMGAVHPEILAEMRGVKAEGGWGVVCTEYCSIHPSSDDTPHPYCSLWDDQDVANLRLMTDKVHAHGALAGVELWHGGMRSSNILSREAPLGPASMPVPRSPQQSMRMDLSDIRELRRWHRDAARRAKQAGFDVVYVYCAHTYLLGQFLCAQRNTRADEYGGSLENRMRLVREILEETREEVGDRCAVALRIEVDNEDGTLDGRRDMLAAFAPLVDLFDVTVADYEREMGASRFTPQGSLEAEIAHVRALTGKPVAAVGRFTSPEMMAAQVSRGILDLVGAARPSIADPFLPAKIREGRADEIRECIGCNICYAGNGNGAPMRCTQNPTMGDEWRRGWHPERVPPRKAGGAALVVGSGPAGLEAALVLGKRGFEVMLAEAGGELGGRVTRESRLPGLGQWARVRDHRTWMLSQMPNVSVFRGSRMGADEIAETGAAHVFLATGSRWRADGRGRSALAAIPGLGGAETFTPDEILEGRMPEGRVLVLDDDGYVMGTALAEMLAAAGRQVSYVACGPLAGAWAAFTNEIGPVYRRLRALGVSIATSKRLAAFAPGEAELACVFTDEREALAVDAVVPVTSREPEEGLWRALSAAPQPFATLRRIGDCRAPGLIAAAVHDGHLAGREFDLDVAPPLRDRPRVAAVSPPPASL